jgi:hypothetical protein
MTCCDGGCCPNGMTCCHLGCCPDGFICTSTGCAIDSTAAAGTARTATQRPFVDRVEVAEEEWVQVAPAEGVEDPGTGAA